MSKIKVRPDLISCGDLVEFAGNSYIVTSMEYDNHNAWDFYLMDKDGVKYHRIVTEDIELLYG